MDGLPCKQNVIIVSENDTTVEDMEINLECDQVGRVVSFESLPNPQDAVILTLCEVKVFGFNSSGLNLSVHEKAVDCFEYKKVLFISFNNLPTENQSFVVGMILKA